MQESRQALEAAFLEAYGALNDAQRQAVDTIEGPVMVIAGPGTGKTQVLSLRIANILRQTDTDPSSILALTFTESGAAAMRERLHRYVGSRAYQIPIHTFHGFAERLIRDYPDSFPTIIGGRIATDLDRISILEAVLESAEVAKLRPAGDPTYYVGPLRHIISSLKQEYVTPDGLADIVRDQARLLESIAQYHEKGAHKGKVRGEYTKAAESLRKNEELLFVYRAYEAALREARLYDFDDMIVAAVRALATDESMLRDLQERYQYILADEHQDVNGAQNKLLELLTNFHDNPNIFVVGDEKQAIYRFQGASLENFLYFQDHYPRTTVIELTRNYRSGQPILDVAHSLVAVEEGPLAALRVPLQAAAVPSAQVFKRHYAHQAVEDASVVALTQDAIARGIAPREIAVIVRTNREVETLAALLRKAGIPATATADNDILAHPITAAIESLLKVAAGIETDAALFTLLHGPYWGLPLADVLKLLAARSYDTPLAVLLGDEARLAALELAEPEKARAILPVLERARQATVTLPPHRVLEQLLQESGLLAHTMAHDPYDGARVIRRLYDEVEALVVRDGVTSLRAVLDTFARLRTYRIALNAPYIETSADAVQVMTAHKSKGLEFSVVIVPHLQDSVWGGGTKRTYFTIPLPRLVREDIEETIDDERRLFYVAMTRAKHELHLSSADTNSDGRVLVPTRLFDELDQSILTTAETETFAASFNPVRSLGERVPQPTLSTAVIARALETRGFSATSFNNYVENPFEYLYRNVLRIPEVQPTHMQFGTAIHNTLEFATRYRGSHSELPSTTAVVERLSRELGKLPLSTAEFARLHEKGLAVLVPYLEHLARTVGATTKEELNITVMLETGLAALPLLPLTGKLDRLDFDTSGRLTRVLDYKTGKPKSRNELEGKTKNSDGSYKRQLAFYALLLSLYNDDRYQTDTFTLSFVEPTPAGTIVEESFVVTEEEIALLRTEIIAAVTVLLEGTFFSDVALAEQSTYGAYVKALHELG